MSVRHSSAYLALTGGLLLALAGVAVHAHWSAQAAAPLLDRVAALVGKLELTDLCLFTEASYTRHLSMTDRYTPFQDSPMTFEHFPSGALVGPPAQLTGP